MTDIRLTDSQRRAILLRFGEHAERLAHTSVWARRKYAPMHIHHPTFAALKRQIQAHLPDYVITFDVVFESDGRDVAWHTDYESIGPFRVASAWRAIRDEHFKSVHFNLTPDGGALRTLPSSWLSFVAHATIVGGGIFGTLHTLFLRIFGAWLARRAATHPNDVGHGNVFGNMSLHSVTAGAPRTSYVVRLARRGCVKVDDASLEVGIARSDNCIVFTRLRKHLARRCLDVSYIDWGRWLGMPAVYEEMFEDEEDQDELDRKQQ